MVVWELLSGVKLLWNEQASLVWHADAFWGGCLPTERASQRGGCGWVMARMTAVLGLL